MLFWNQAPVAIDVAWQSEIEASLEAGWRPLLDLGSSQLSLEDVTMLTALRTFVDQRVDVSAPVMLAGGHSVLWLAVLMHQPSTALHQSLAPTLVFAGADRATYLATLTTLLPGQFAETERLAQSAPANMAALFTPYTQARTALPWDLLPFAVTEEALAGPRSSAEHQTVDSPDATRLEPWISWAAIGLTLLLVLFALIP
ncbi:MAG: hypothetical protein NT075_04135 [Chloroflexi bacterium]|nr:hypothetical protein [Chloroflexota bacterium]